MRGCQEPASTLPLSRQEPEINKKKVAQKHGSPQPGWASSDRAPLAFKAGFAGHVGLGDQLDLEDPGGDGGPLPPLRQARLQGC